LNDVQTALRNTLTHARMYGDATQYAIVVHGTGEDIDTAKKLVANLDRPKKAYRVTYTVTDSDAGKGTGAQHYSLIVTSGSKTILKQGNRVPLVTGMPEGGTATQSSQVQYIDIGLNIEAGVEGVGLRTKVEISGVADEKSGIGVQDPVVRQTMVEGMLNLGVHKPLVLGSIDIPGTTRHEEIEVTAEQLPQ
jgi:type II secretory pathway component GspD/PulD (secretin)